MASATQRAGGGVSLLADPKDKQPGELTELTTVLREFGGVNVQSPREAIGDNQFAWLEELCPIGPGNLAPVKGPSGAIVTIAGEVGAPTYSMSYNQGGADFEFAVWSGSGNAWIVNHSTGAATQVAAGIYTSGQTVATQWNNLGLLIVDPVVGYRDWNITAANTLTNLSGQIYNLTLLSSLVPSAPTTVPPLRVIDSGGGGSGATIGISVSAGGMTLTAAGTGYLLGDILTLSGGTLTTSSAAPVATRNQPTTVTVTAVGGAGAITGFSITNPGYYQTAPNPNPVATTTGGAGTGATFTISWAYAQPYIITPGSGYVTPTPQAFIGVSWVSVAWLTALTSGTLLGTAIAVYAGRVWVAIKRTVQFTDAGSYSSFANSGSAFTINDSYLHNNITALFAANNYLYIFGDDSVNILSNVQVVNGLAQFSNINVSSSIGCTQPLSVFAYGRTVAFANNSGFYVLSGATPEKISDDLDNLVSTIDFSKPIYGGPVMVNNLLCAAFLFKFSDTFVGAGAARYIIALLFRGKWFFTSQSGGSSLSMSTFTSTPVSGLLTGYGWSGNKFYSLMTSTNAAQWLLKTKLWDSQSPMLDKQAIFAGIGSLLNGLPTLQFTLSVDNENGSAATTAGISQETVTWVNASGQTVSWTNNAGQTVTWIANASGYQLITAAANQGGGKYLGLTAQGYASNTSQIRLLALALQRTRRW